MASLTCSAYTFWKIAPRRSLPSCWSPTGEKGPFTFFILLVASYEECVSYVGTSDDGWRPKDGSVLQSVFMGYLYSLDRHLVAQVLGGPGARSVLLLRAFVSLLDLSNKDVSIQFIIASHYVDVSGSPLHQVMLPYTHATRLLIAAVTSPDSVFSGRRSAASLLQLCPAFRRGAGGLPHVGNAVHSVRRDQRFVPLLLTLILSLLMPLALLLTM